MSFLDKKDPAKRTALVDEYVKAMKTVRRRNMVNCEMKLAIEEEMQTLFHPIVSATKQAAEKTAEELAPVKKALVDIDGTLKAQKRTMVRPSPPSPPQKDLTFGIHATGDGRNTMGNSIVHIEGNTLKVGDKVYELTPGWRMLIVYKKPRPRHYTRRGSQINCIYYRQGSSRVTPRAGSRVGCIVEIGTADTQKVH